MASPTAQITANMYQSAHSHRVTRQRQGCCSVRIALLQATLLAALTAIPLSTSADALIGSWNIKHLGWNNDKVFDAVTHVANHFDLLAIQELMDPMHRMERELEAISGEG